MIRAHRIRLYPNQTQATALAKAAGCARFTWNWALAEAEKHYKETGKTVNLSELKARWNRDKPAWVKESPKDANQQPFTNLASAYKRFFAKMAKKPTFKCKHRCRDSFYISNDRFKLTGTHAKLPRIGKVRLAEPLRYTGRINAGVVSCNASGHWYLSVQVRTPDLPETPGTKVLGVDLGLKTFATISDGTTLVAPEPLKANSKRLAKLQRRYSRKQKGSKNQAKARVRVARLHQRISDIRQDYLHKQTTKLVAKAKLLCIEDLGVKGMTKLWGRKTSDLSLYEFRRMLTYKCQMHGVALVIADRWFPSTQLCSGCGARHKLTLDTRTYECTCGLKLDRDINAAINLSTVGLAESNACGHTGSDYKHTLVVKPEWLKQELERGTCPTT